MNTIYQIYRTHKTTCEIYSEETCETLEQVIEQVAIGAYEDTVDPDVVCVVGITGLTDGPVSIERISPSVLQAHIDGDCEQAAHEVEHVRIENHFSNFI